MKTFLKNSELINALEQRYAVKQFGKRDGDFSELENTVKNILRLTPTSFGLQAYKFIIPKTPELREKLREHSWGQGQVTDSDLLVVFTVPTNFDKSYIDSHMDNMVEIRNMDKEKRDGIAGFMDEKIIQTGEELGITNFEEWLAKQAYIGLGNLMTSLAILGIDSCPLEGLNPAKYDEILGLKEKNLTAKVALAIGKRHVDDKYQYEKKVRFSNKELFIEM